MNKRKKQLCGKRTYMEIHPSVCVGGVCVDVCQREVLPQMVVCEEHADKGSLVYLVKSMAREIAVLKKELDTKRRKTQVRAEGSKPTPGEKSKTRGRRR